MTGCVGRRFRLTAIAALAVAAACGGPGDASRAATAGASAAAARPTRPALPPLDSGLVFQLSVDSGTASRPTLEVATNLPDGTEIMFGLERRHSADNPMQSRGIVRSGVARSEMFGPSEGLAVGEYEADATIPYPHTQPPAVQAVIGTKGEALRVSPGGAGPRVEIKRNEMFGATARTSTRFSVGGRYARDVAARETDVAIREIRAIIGATDSLLRDGRAMDRFRRTEDLDRIGECGRRMRANLARHEELDRRTIALPAATPGRIHVIGALGSARSCSVCTDDAMRWCRDASTQLDEARGSLRRDAAERATP